MRWWERKWGEVRNVMREGERGVESWEFEWETGVKLETTQGSGHVFYSKSAFNPSPPPTLPWCGGCEFQRIDSKNQKICSMLHYLNLPCFLFFLPFRRVAPFVHSSYSLYLFPLSHPISSSFSSSSSPSSLFSSISVLLFFFPFSVSSCLSFSFTISLFFPPHLILLLRNLLLHSFPSVLLSLLFLHFAVLVQQKFQHSS